MDLNSIVLYLKAKGMSAREINSDLVATLGTKVLGYSTVTPWLREAQLDQFSETAVDFTEDVEVDEIAEAILSAVEVQAFDLMRDIVRPSVLLVPLSIGMSHVHRVFWSAIFVLSRMP
jgi:hypothetical protein